MTFTGDLSLSLNGQGDWDITYENGQPLMTDELVSCMTLAIFGDPNTWQNELTNDASEKYTSKFPEVIKTGRVNNDTINGGSAALNDCLQFMIKEGMAKTIDVTGGIITVYAIQWKIDVTKPEGTNFKYNINWVKGVLSAVTNNTNS